MPRFKKRKKQKAPATVLFTSEKNDEGKRQTCVFAQCHFSGNGVGPIWGHSDASVKRALATLTEECDCPAQYHQNKEQQGKRLS
jgi:hypothetical protein